MVTVVEKDGLVGSRDGTGGGRPRILRCIASVNPATGGIIEATVQSSRALESMGIDTEIASLDRAGEDHVLACPFPCHALGTGRGGYGYAPAFVPWLQAHREHYDAVIIEGIWQYHSYGTWLGMRGSAVPYFVYPHGMLDRWFKEAYPLKHLKKVLYWRLAENQSFRDAQAILFTCEEERQLARNCFRPYECEEKVVGLGIAAPVGDSGQQVEAFLGKYPELKGHRILLFLGRLHEKKGCDLLIKAYQSLKPDQRAGEPPLHLVMAGPCADGAYLAELKSLAGTAADITFTGMLSGDLKWGAYHAADAFILPSHQENFGIAVVEALACGAPVLISDKVNIWREIVEDGGGVTASDDLAGVTKLVHSWVDWTETDRPRMHHAARACFERRFESLEAAHQLLAVLGFGARRSGWEARQGHANGEAP